MQPHNFVIYKPERGMFYRPQSGGYTENPAVAGLYTELYAKRYAETSNGVVKAYPIDSRFVKDRLRLFQARAASRMFAALEGLAPSQRIRVFADAVEAKQKSDDINFPKQREHKETFNV